MTLKVLIQPDDYTADGLPEKCDSFSDKWTTFLKDRGVNVEYTNVFSTAFWDQVKDADGFMWRWPHWGLRRPIAMRTISTLEHLSNIECFPNLATCWHYDDKIAQALIFSQVDIPSPKTYVFFDRGEAANFVSNAEFPLVLKFSSGAGAVNVQLVEDRALALQWVDRMFTTGAVALTQDELHHVESKPIDGMNRLRSAIRVLMKGAYPKLPESRPKGEFEYESILFQEFCPDNAYDTRITVIGDRAFCYTRDNRPNDFRASGSGNFVWDQSRVDFGFVELAVKLAKRIGSESCAVDGLYLNGKPCLSECSYTYTSWAVHECPGHWKVSTDDDGNITDKEWIDGKMWPEQAHVEVFMKRLERSNSAEQIQVSS